MSANTQGAIVMVGVIPLFDVKEIPYLWRVSKLDLLCWLVGELCRELDSCSNRCVCASDVGGRLGDCRVLTRALCASP